MTKTSKIVMMGASGAVGGQALQALLGSSNLERVTVLGRRKLEQTHAALEQQVVDVADPKTYASFLAGHDAALCALGVGQPSKMSREEFLRIDRDAVLAFGAACKAAGIPHFSILTAVGSNAKSPSFYVKTKGQIEEGLRALGFESLSLFEPSMILTPTNRYGLSQAITLKLWPWLDLVLQGPLRKFRGVRVERLGQAMAADALEHGPGEKLWTWDEFQAVRTS